MQFIESFTVEGFRGLSPLKLDGLGRVNLITGKNNSGKSSVLEAIRLLATAGSVQTFREVLDYREELGGIDSENLFGAGDLSGFSNLFSGRPDLSSSESATIQIRAEGNLPSSLQKFTARVGWFARRSDPEQNTVVYEPAEAMLFLNDDIYPALEITLGSRRKVTPLDRIIRRPALYRTDSDVTQIPCVYVDPFSSRSTNQLAFMWDAIALTESEKEVVSALKVISPEIEAVSMVGSDERPNRRGRIAIAKSRRFFAPVPLRTFGDGVNRLFGIVLSLCNAKNGILLIDELENGLHYSVQLEIWEAIYRLARALNVQVFATSHSWDCVRSFQTAAARSNQDGVLIRLTKKDDRVVATTFTEDELKIVTRDGIEVR